jgi:hypothetical protein
LALWLHFSTKGKTHKKTHTKTHKNTQKNTHKKSGVRVFFIFYVLFFFHFAWDSFSLSDSKRARALRRAVSA